MSTKLRVKQIIDSGSRPEFDKAHKNNLMLKKGRKFVRLSKDDGEPTPASLFWQGITGQTLPDSGFMSQTAVRDGNAEYIKLRDGKRGITRQLSLETGEWIFTKLGLKYYKRLGRNYVVNVPVIIRGTPPDGRVYTKKRHCLFPNSASQVPP